MTEITYDELCSLQYTVIGPINFSAFFDQNVPSRKEQRGNREKAPRKSSIAVKDLEKIFLEMSYC